LRPGARGKRGWVLSTDPVRSSFFEEGGDTLLGILGLADDVAGLILDDLVSHGLVLRVRVTWALASSINVD
jgi:hypothetical protein